MKAWYTIFFWLLNILCMFPLVYTTEPCLLSKSPSLLNQFWIRGEYLGWTLKKSPVPIPLITSASFSDPISGAIGQPGTKVLLGNKAKNMGWQNGFQLTAGAIINEKQSISVEGCYFLVPKVTKKNFLSTTGEPGSPDFAVPIFDVTGFWGLNGVPGETVYLLPGPLFSDPGFEARFKLKVSSQFQGAEFNSLIYFGSREGFNVEGLGGFRWLQLQENFTFAARSMSVPNVSFPPGFYNFKDRFNTNNNFFGGQLGLRFQYENSYWHLESTTKIGLGVLNQRVDIHGVGETLGGNLFFATNGPAQKLVGGVFSQPTNIGKHTRNAFATNFETGFRAGYKINNQLEIYLGYNFLLLNHVARPGDQINRKINPTLTGLADVSRATVGIGTKPIPFGVPGAAEAPAGPKEPDFHFKTKLFWAQGLVGGLVLRF
jgi:hypothetical protein